MKKETYNVAVVGATGAVGNEMVAILEERDFPVNKLKLLASKRGAGTRMEFKGKFYAVQLLDEKNGRYFLVNDVLKPLVRRDFFFAKIAHHFLCLRMFFGECEIHCTVKSYR